MTTVATSASAAGLLDAYADSQHLIGGSPNYRRDRVTAAARFLATHPDLDVWMARPLDTRLAELHRRPLVWPLVGFALLTGRCRPDQELLFAKKFGHSMARWTAALFPHDLVRLQRRPTGSPWPARPPHSCCGRRCRWRSRSVDTLRRS
jgi:hypothetical protein